MTAHLQYWILSAPTPPSASLGATTSASVFAGSAMPMSRASLGVVTGPATFDGSALVGSASQPFTIDFSEPGITFEDTITNQYAANGITFSGSGQVASNYDDAPDQNSLLALDNIPTPPGSSPYFLYSTGITAMTFGPNYHGGGTMTIALWTNNKPFSITSSINGSTVVAWFGSNGTGSVWTNIAVPVVGPNVVLTFNANNNPQSDYAIDNIRFS